MVKEWLRRGKKLLLLLVCMIMTISVAACQKEEENTITATGATTEGGTIDEPLTLDVRVGLDDKVMIPEPGTVTNGAVTIFLKEEPEYEDLYADSDTMQESLYAKYVADLSFAGFEEPVLILGAVVGNFTDEAEEKNCLALHVVTDMATAADYEKDNYSRQCYLVILDYKRGTCHKMKTECAIHNVGEFLNLKAIDLTGDNVQELIVENNYSKSMEFDAYRFNRKEDKLESIYSTSYDMEKEDDYPDRKEFEGALLDDYKVKLSFPCIGYSEVFSVIRDGGYKKKDLEVKNKWDEWGCIKPTALWDDGKLVEKMVKKDTVFLYTLDHIDYVTDKDGLPQVEFVRSVDIGHRSETIGNMHIYLEYEKTFDTLVIAKAEFFDIKQAQKEWDEWND